jgi:CTP:molybdopterin cytidylyltransferase MocA
MADDPGAPPPGTSRVGGLVLAAGAGRRFGGPKALAEVGGERLVDRAVRILRSGGCRPVLVVHGAVPLVVPGADLVVDNQAWAEGMGSSLRAGLSSSGLAGCTAVVVLLVDLPDVRPAAVLALLSAHGSGAELAVATYAGERGHPVLIGRRHWTAVMAHAVGDVGARSYLGERPDEVVEVPCDGLGGVADVDTPDDAAHRGVIGGGRR